MMRVEYTTQIRQSNSRPQFRSQVAVITVIHLYL